jgi:hypothetical protein
MTALVLDGKALAAQTEAELLQRVEQLKEKSGGKTPILATILVGDDPASATYVKMKGNACRRVGMDSLAVELPSSTTTEQLLSKIEELNSDPNVHGILLQHPVPEQIDERACFDAIALSKDVDGVTCLGFGRMAMGESAYGCAQYRNRRQTRCSGGSLTHPRQTHGDDVAAGKCHGHHLPFSHQKPARTGQASGHYCGCGGQTRIYQGRLGQGRRRGR